MTRFNIQKTVRELTRRLEGKRSIDLTLKNGRQIIVAKNFDGYTIYEGCELICGDITAEYAAQIIIELAQEVR